jgi:hypothetical protein
MMNHSQRDEPPFWPTAVVAVITILVMTGVIIGWDGIVTLWHVISPF